MISSKKDSNQITYQYYVWSFFLCVDLLSFFGSVGFYYRASKQTHTLKCKRTLEPDHTQHLHTRTHCGQNATVQQTDIYTDGKMDRDRERKRHRSEHVVYEPKQNTNTQCHLNVKTFEFTMRSLVMFVLRRQRNTHNGSLGQPNIMAWDLLQSRQYICSFLDGRENEQLNSNVFFQFGKNKSMMRSTDKSNL